MMRASHAPPRLCRAQQAPPLPAHGGRRHLSRGIPARNGRMCMCECGVSVAYVHECMCDCEVSVAYVHVHVWGMSVAHEHVNMHVWACHGRAFVQTCMNKRAREGCPPCGGRRPGFHDHVGVAPFWLKGSVGDVKQELWPFQGSLPAAAADAWARTFQKRVGVCVVRPDFPDSPERKPVLLQEAADLRPKRLCGDLVAKRPVDLRTGRAIQAHCTSAACSAPWKAARRRTNPALHTLSHTNPTPTSCCSSANYNSGMQCSLQSQPTGECTPPCIPSPTQIPHPPRA
eukprot:365372-Chlamydomonas_euryale.AAC.2